MAVSAPRTAVALLVTVQVQGRRRPTDRGATAEESGADRPGDDLLARPDLTTTRAV